MDGVGIWIKNYKCFGDSPTGFDSLEKLNLIVGRNNSGKSALLDLIGYACLDTIQFAPDVFHNGSQPQLVISIPLTEEALRYAFPETMKGGRVPGVNHWDYGIRYVGRPVKGVLLGANKFDQLELPRITGQISIDDLPGDYRRKLTSKLLSPFSDKSFKRIYPERDISPEDDLALDLGGNHNVDGHGHGITNVIQNFINKSYLNRAYVEKDLLDALNDICAPDSEFKKITCQQRKDQKWEIYLEEKDKGLVSLTNTGSGLKSIIIVLSHLILIPILEKREVDSYLFAFEELENNLHPALLRRMLSFIFASTSGHETPVFFTSHSNVMIDVVNNMKDSQILHVTHDSRSARVEKVVTRIETAGILDDLDVRASDILQANGVVWVEGPSDRVYFNRWISLFTNDELTEGLHYQVVFYGGRLLSHLSASEQEDAKGVKLLHVNRNNMLIIDSDKRSAQSRINATKRRLKSEIEDGGGLAWVTSGREIENYIPPQAILSLIGAESTNYPDKYDDVFNWIDTLKSGKGTEWKSKKPLFAEQIVPLLEKEQLEAVWDFSSRITSAIKEIKKWNRIDE